MWIGDPYDYLHDLYADTVIGTGVHIPRDQFYRHHLSSSPAHGSLPPEPGLAWHWAPATAQPAPRAVSSCEQSPAPHSAPTTKPE